jgi:hypothetical protein
VAIGEGPVVSPRVGGLLAWGPDERPPVIGPWPGPLVRGEGREYICQLYAYCITQAILICSSGIFDEIHAAVDGFFT